MASWETLSGRHVQAHTLREFCQLAQELPSPSSSGKAENSQENELNVLKEKCTWDRQKAPRSPAVQVPRGALSCFLL